MKKHIITSLLLLCFVNAFTQAIIQNKVIDFAKNEEKIASNAVHSDLLATSYFFPTKNKALKLSEIIGLELARDVIPSDYTSKKDSLNRLYTVNSGWNILLSIGYGPETVLSGFLPSVGALNFQSTSNERFHYYYGGKVNLWILFAIWGSTAITSGVKYGIFSLESNFSLFFRPRQSADNGAQSGAYFHTAFNPKIGLYLKGFWFRFGPSFILYKRYDSEPWTLIEPLRRGELQYNFELGYIQGIQKK